jgi:hypothetical protein
MASLLLLLLFFSPFASSASSLGKRTFDPLSADKVNRKSISFVSVRFGAACRGKKKRGFTKHLRREETIQNNAPCLPFLHPFLSIPFPDSIPKADFFCHLSFPLVPSSHLLSLSFLFASSPFLSGHPQRLASAPARAPGAR